ncbi:hypothetical protein ACFO1B_10110 [Dactylosporangium siamense]|uniref:Lipoprotein n=1 Tax=Dactylosporangium siamense TaxID=685454 RepID=A0A919PRX7_9ACTN|nr:hypothetical protein [Dactylosporangium siamense]GIG49049.1 hypothetical protein Dsi01nite_070900 [Dactylosporangium siamense]
MRRSLGTILATLVLIGTAGCGRPAVDNEPASGDTRATDVYVQVLRRYLANSSENSFPDDQIRQVFILDRAMPGIGDPQPGAPAGRPIPVATQRDIVDALAEARPVSFVADRASVITSDGGCEVVRDGGILITLGPVDGDGNRVKVGINGYVACLGATWLTYVVQHTAGTGWQVTGTTGSMTVA